MRGSLVFAALLACSTAAHAQRRGPAQPEDILPDSELDDPIGLDAESRALGESAAERPDAPAKCWPPSPACSRARTR